MPGLPAVPGVRRQQPDRVRELGRLTGPERRALQSGWLRAARRDRDEAIRAAHAGGFTVEAIGRSFGLSRVTVTRILRRENRGARAESDRLTSRPPLREGGL